MTPSATTSRKMFSAWLTELTLHGVKYVFAPSIEPYICDAGKMEDILQELIHVKYVYINIHIYIYTNKHLCVVHVVF